MADTVVFESALKYGLKEIGKEDFILKGKQHEALESIVVHGNDTLAILPTGYGKSLIYQLLPAVFDFMCAGGQTSKIVGNLVLVVSPLNALMRNQVEKLRASGVKVCIWKGEDDKVSNAIPRPSTELFDLKGKALYPQPILPRRWIIRIVRPTL